MRFSSSSVSCRKFHFKAFLGLCAVVCLAFHFTASASAQNTPASSKASDAASAAVPGQDAAQTNDRLMQLALADRAKQGDYIIGSGDLLNIEVFDVAELSREVRVNESGFVALPLIPVRVQASGLTTIQLQDKVTELLQVNGLVSHPLVTVSVKEQHSAPITIIGAVNKPTVIQATPRTTLLEALSEAGGVTNDAGASVLVTRSAGAVDQDTVGQNGTANSSAQDATRAPVITVDLNELLNTGEAKYNIPLLGGDVVTVPRAGVIYAVGALTHPGGFVTGGDRQQMTVLKILSLSGGLTPTAKSADAVIVRQNGAGERREVPVDLRKILAMKTEDVPLQQSDILFVPDSTSKHALRKTAEIAISLATGAAIVNAGRF
jgi:polysaccharide export outer membrane protein